MKLIKTLILALFSGGFGMLAVAQEAACPEGAATKMYQIAGAAGQTADPGQLNAAYSNAVQLTQLCPTDPFVQFFAAHTFAQVAGRIQDPPSRLQALSDATAALFRYEKLGTADFGGPVFKSGLTWEDGSEAVVDTSASGKQLLTEIIVPQVVELEARAQFHPFISGKGRTQDAACPYRTPGWAEAEAAGYAPGFETIAPYFLENGASPNPMGAVERMEWLVAACPDAEEGVSFQLGFLWVQAADWYEYSDDGEGVSDAAGRAITWLTRSKELIEARGGPASALASTNRLLADMKALHDD